MTKAPAKPKTKAGSSTYGTAAREAAFVDAYMTNGQNASAAALAAGFSGSKVRDMGWRMLQRPGVQARLALRAQKVAELADMNANTWARELRAIAFSRVGDLLGPDGKPAPVATLPDHVQAAIASVKVTDEGRLMEYKFWNKNDALVTIARHLGLFEKDNAQLKPDIKVQVVLVG